MVSGAHVSPLPYNSGVILVRGALLSPYALRHWHMVRLDWHEHRLKVCGVTVLSFLAYFLILTALVFTPVSYIALVREIGVLFGAVAASNGSLSHVRYLVRLLYRTRHDTGPGSGCYLASKVSWSTERKEVWRE